MSKLYHVVNYMADDPSGRYIKTLEAARKEARLQAQDSPGDTVMVRKLEFTFSFDTFIDAMNQDGWVAKDTEVVECTADEEGHITWSVRL